MKVVHVGLAGLGTVGFGTYRVLTENAREITARTGLKIEVTRAVVRNVEKARNKTGGTLDVCSDFSSILDDPEIDVIVEVMGGIEPARTLILQAIERGKHVVTANKHLIATHGEEILRAAEARGVVVAYEAAVAGGIPIIKALREGLAANKIQSVSGIVNGTSNFILTKMREDGALYEKVLSEAQRLGYAEADPTFDVEGIDAAHKMTILAALAFGTPFEFQPGNIEGISSLAAEDVAIAASLGMKIKLIGQAKKVSEGIALSVCPRLVGPASLLYYIEDVVNAVEVVSSGLGSTFYSGRGAGERPTASAVVADIIDIARTLDIPFENRVPMAGVWPEAREEVSYLPLSEQQSRFYVRFSQEDAALAKETFSQNGIAVKDALEKDGFAIFITELTKEGQLDKALQCVKSKSKVSPEALPVKLHVFDS